MRNSLRSAATSTLLALALAAASVARPAVAQQKQTLGSVPEALRASQALSGRRGPASVNWIEGGRRFSFTTVNPATRRSEIRVYDPKSLEDQQLFDPAKLTLPGTSQPFEYRSFQWAADSKHLLFESNFRPIYRRSGISDYYVYSLADHSLKLATRDARTAELSPDGGMIGYEREGDMYVYDFAADAEKRLTHTEGDSVFDGHYDWVYEEEFGQAQAWKWSPDSRHLAFWRTDEHGVPHVHLTDYQEDHPDWIQIPIPLVGDPNPHVKIGVVDVKSGRTTWLDTGLDSSDTYIPRIYWTGEPDTLAVLTLNRAQNHVQVFFFDVRDGGRRKVFDETSPTWIDVYDFYAGVNDMLYFPEGLRQFFWVSDRDGHQQLYRYDYSGKLLGQITKGDFTLTRVEAIDAKKQTVYYTSTEPSPLQRQLWAIRFDGTGKRRLSKTPGTHHIDMSPDAQYYIDRWSSTRTPTQVELWSTAGRKLRTLEDNADVTEYLKTHEYSPLELFSFTTSDGVKLDGSMIKPPHMQPGTRYPVVFSIYGGPGSQQVYDAFASNGWQQYLAQHGYIVVGLNNRGTANYSRDFMKVVYKRLGKYESQDFVEAAKYLAVQPYVDGDHMAIQGTSYGGYSTVYTMLTHPGIFTLGIANSAVTDWRLYDSIYTERYMGLLSNNEQGYVQSAAMPHADGLQGHLLLVHSAMDDNVHPVNTMQLLTALTDAGKDAELRFYPPGAHGAAYNGQSYVLMTEVYTNELCEWLHAPACQVSDLNR